MKTKSLKSSLMSFWFPLLVIICITGSAAIIWLPRSPNIQENIADFCLFWQFIFTDASVVPFAICAVAGFCLSGFFWGQNAGWKRYFYYTIFLFFGLMVGYGSMSYAFVLKFRTFGDTPLFPISVMPYWLVLGSGFVAVIFLKLVTILKK